MFRGVLLKTCLVTTAVSGGAECSTDEPVLRRTLLFDGRLHEQHTVQAYVPPLFLLVMYETSPVGRYVRRQSAYSFEDEKDAADSTTAIKTTDVALKENEIVVNELLKAADCSPDTVTHSFLRLEHAGSLQSQFFESFPTPALRIGRLTKLTFKSARKRNCALDVLHENAAANSDVYAINYSSNACITTVTRYLEPLFRHALRLQKDWSVGVTENEDEGDSDNDHGKRDDSIFDVCFHLFDPKTTVREQRRDPSENGETILEDIDAPIFVAGSSSSRSSARFQTQTVIKERKGRASPLTVHDISRFYAHLPFYGDRGGAEKLHFLPVVYVRHELDFICLSGCREYKNRLVVLHVYYTWKVNLAERLSRLREEHARNEDYIEKVAVCDVFNSRAAAYVKMLEDAKKCFWKKKPDAYVRLVLNSAHEARTYSRFVLHDILYLKTSADKVSLQSTIEGSRNAADSQINVYPNSISLDCSKIVEDLDDSAFALAYERCTKTATFYASSDGAGDATDDVLLARQLRVNNLLLQFKKERIASLCYKAASEMYVGVLDLYGVDTEITKRNDFVSNYMFVRTLVKDSIYIGPASFNTDLFELLINEGVKMKDPDVTGDKSKTIPTPMTWAKEGVFSEQGGTEIVEFDMESAYPSLIDTFNVSQETTVIMRRGDFEKTERQLKTKTGLFSLGRWYSVVPYEDAPQELVVASLAGSVYKGFTGAALRSLILKRRNSGRIMARFYKKLANKVCGCTAQEGNDLYALHCYAATTSLCKTLMSKTLERLKETARVLRAQTDGGLVQSTIDAITVPLDETVREAFTNAADVLLKIRSCVDTLLNLRTRRVNTCLIAGQNRYAIRYSSDGPVLLKGHPGKYVPNATAEIAVRDAFGRTIDDVIRNSDQYNCMTIVDILLFEHLEGRRLYAKNTDELDDDDSYFTEYVFPSEKDHGVHIPYNEHCRFGDNVPLWTIRESRDSKRTRLVCRPASHTVINRVCSLRKLVKFWTYELCRIKCFDHKDKKTFERLFANRFRDLL